MDKIVVRGGRALQGSLAAAGAKNAVLPAMAASLLTEGEMVLERTPRVHDVLTMARLLEHLGAAASFEQGRCRLQVRRPGEPEAPYDLVRTMRASVLVLGPLLARTGQARVSLPGGCAIGERPVNLHLEGLTRLGAEVTLEHGYITARCRRLRGAELTFPTRTVTGTENLMMAATLAEGKTILHNCSLEPEVEDLAHLLISMGARIEGMGSETLGIEGVDSLHGATHAVIPDRIEIGTFLAAAVITRGSVTVTGCDPDHLSAFLDVLRSCGVDVSTTRDTISVSCPGTLRSRDITTSPYPGFPTDLQAQYMALMTQAHGSSMINETIFENRFMHAGELRRMGADITLDGHTAIVRGPSALSGAPLMATDLRASASLIIAALAAAGVSVINRVYHIDRGYERIEERMRSLGADIERVS